MDSAAISQDDHHIGIITALPIERAAIRGMLDEEYGKPVDFKQSSHDPNNYTWGRISATEILQHHDSDLLSTQNNIKNASGSVEQPASPSELTPIGSVTSQRYIVSDFIQDGSLPFWLLNDSTTPGFLAKTPKIRGFIDSVKHKLLVGAEIATSSRLYHETLLHALARQGHLASLTLLLDKGYDLEAVNNSYETPLYAAAEFGHVDVVRVLIEHNANIEAAAKVGTTPLYTAAEHGHLGVVKFLIDKKANIEGTRKCPTPLHIASQKSHLDVVRFLIKGKANIEAAWDGATPLYIAARNGHLDMVKFLINEKANIEGAPNGPTPLYIAARNGHLDVVQFLLDNGADIRGAPGYAGPVDVARREGHDQIVKLLVKKDAGA